MQIQGQIVDIENRRIYAGEITVENGKITSTSTDIFFPIDGFTDFNCERVLAAQDELQMRIARIWGCKTIVGLVDSENPYMEL